VLEFNVDDRVFLKVSSIKSVMQFGMHGKLSPGFVGPFKILENWHRGISTGIFTITSRCAWCIPCLYVEKVCS